MTTTYTIKCYDRHIEGISEILGSLSVAKRLCRGADEAFFFSQMEGFMNMIRSELKGLPPAGTYIEKECETS